MHSSLTCAILILSLAGSATAQGRAGPGEVALDLNAEQASHLDLHTIRLAATQLPETIDAIARVMDVGALAQLDSEIEAASAAAVASEKEAKRLAVLEADDQGASRQALEAAQARAAADTARLRLARQRIALEWGPGLARMSLSERQTFVQKIGLGQAALLRVDPLQAQNPASGPVHLQLDDASPPLATESLGPAAIAEPRMQTAGLLVALRGEAAASFRAGRLQSAAIASGRLLSGVSIPRDALVRVEGRTWAYVREDDEHFLRREVVEPKWQSAGWFVSMGFKAGDEVVDRGAGTLLAVELNDNAEE